METVLWRSTEGQLKVEQERSSLYDHIYPMIVMSEWCLIIMFWLQCIILHMSAYFVSGSVSSLLMHCLCSDTVNVFPVITTAASTSPCCDVPLVASLVPCVYSCCPLFAADYADSCLTPIRLVICSASSCHVNPPRGMGW